MSGIYIPGMEMPERCDARCPFYGFKSIYDCSITKKAYNWGLTTRPSDCPLIPVSDHGRLIDADALTKLCVEMQNIEWNNKAAPYSWAYAYESFEGDIDNAPTIIEAEGVDG